MKRSIYAAKNSCGHKLTVLMEDEEQVAVLNPAGQIMTKEKHGKRAIPVTMKLVRTDMMPISGSPVSAAFKAIGR